MKTVYHYDAEYLYDYSLEIADGAPVPADCTTIAPPATDTPYKAQFDTETETWHVIADHRRYYDANGVLCGGTMYWPADAKWLDPCQYMTELGDLPEGVLLSPPPQPAIVDEYYATKIAIQEAKQYLADTDWIIVKIAEGSATPEEYQEEIQRRKTLRESINPNEAKAARLKTEIEDEYGSGVVNSSTAQ